MLEKMTEKIHGACNNPGFCTDQIFISSDDMESLGFDFPNGNQL